MLYNEPESLELLDRAANVVIDVLREIELDCPETCTEFNVNYVIMHILDALYANGKYKAINDAIGVLECVKQEFYQKAQSNQRLFVWS